MSGRRDKTTRGGLAIVETVLVLPVLVLLVFGLIDFALMFHTLHTMTNAARDGARQLAIRGATVEQAKATALDRLSGVGGSFTVTATSGPNRDVTVAISVPKSDIGLGIISRFGVVTGSPNLRTQVTMRKEGD